MTTVRVAFGVLFLLPSMILATGCKNGKPSHDHPPACGNNVTEAGEACDGPDTNGYGCSDLPGFASGELGCRSGCDGYDVSQCVEGALQNAATCSQEDVQATVDAASNGDTAAVPAGNCTWTVPVTITDKNIVLQGAGMDLTVIQDETGDAWNERALRVSCARNPVRITGFTFTGMKRRGSTEEAITIGSGCVNWRIDHTKFDLSVMDPGTQGRGLIVGGTGVVDHCVFLNTYQGVAVQGDGDASWERAQALGTADAVYMEDNDFDYTEDYAGDGANDAYGGARYVMRFNQVTNARIGHHGLDSGGYRSPHSFEIYGNTLTMTIDNWWYGIRFRGGTGVVFDNTFNGGFQTDTTIGVVNYRTCCEVSHDNCGDWGRCDGVEDVFCSETWTRCGNDNECPTGETCTRVLDGHQQDNGYPCRDQVGRTTDHDGDGVQDLSPLYEWNNTINGEDADTSVNDPWGCENPSMTDHLVEGRDFVNDTEMPGYVPYTYPHPMALLDGSR